MALSKKEKAKLTGYKVEHQTSRLISLMSDGKVDKGELLADWGEMDERWIAWLVRSVVQADGAVLLGKSRDSTQYHVKLYAGMESRNYWFAGSAEGRALFEEWVRAFCEGLEASD